MNREEIKVILDKIIAECNQDNSCTEYEGKSMIRDLEMDSVSLVQMLAEVEERFGISLDDCEDFIELMDSYDRLLQHLCQVLQEG